MSAEPTAKPYRIPALKDQIGWRLTDQDKKNLRILLADRRETNVSQLLRDLVEEEAAPTRARWKEGAARIAADEEAKERAGG